MPDNGPIEIHRFDRARLSRVSVRPGTDTEFANWLDLAINEPACTAAFQEFRKEEPLDYWIMWYDEVHFALAGRARLTYRMPPLFEEEFQVEVEAGDLYLLPIGSESNWEVLSDEPYRTLFICMPRPKWLDF